MHPKWMEMPTELLTLKPPTSARLKPVAAMARAGFSMAGLALSARRWTTYPPRHLRPLATAGGQPATAPPRRGLRRQLGAVLQRGGTVYLVGAAPNGCGRRARMEIVQVRSGGKG